MTGITDLATDSRRGIDNIGIYIGALIHDGNGKILLLKRGQGARDEHGRWDICGGALEFGESIEDALRREINEEICAQAKSIKSLFTCDVHRKQNGINTHWIAIVHSAEVNPRMVKIGEPHKIEEIGWFDIKTLPQPLHSQFKKVLKAALSAKIIG